MTVTSDLARVEYSGNGTTTVFSTGFAFQANHDVRVILTIDTLETDQTENSDYTLTGATHSGDAPAPGTVTMLVAPPAGSLLVIMRNVEFVQDLDGTILSTMAAADQEEALDKIWHAMGQLKEMANRALRATDGNPVPVPGTWTPIFAVELDGADRCVVHIEDWTGGPADSEKPAVGYLGDTGIVATKAEATNIQGVQGVQGPQGPEGPQGPQGIPGPTGPGGSGSGDMLRSNNLSDVLSVPTARNNLGLGDAATKNVGSTAGTVAAGDAVAAKLDKAGGIMTGALVLAGDPGTALEPATKQYTDAADAALAAAIGAKASTASPTFTGDPKAPTPAPGDNDTSIATSAFVKAAIDAALATVSTPLKLQIDHVQNEHLTMQSGYNLTAGGYYAVMKDGSVRFWGGGSTIPFPAGGLPWGLLPGVKVNLPAGLTGTPAKVVQGGREAFIITTTGDCCCMGANANGELGLNDLVAHVNFTLLDATNITPRSPGGASRAIVEICMSGSNYTTTTPLTTMIRCADGTLWASGANGNGQCADGTAVRRQTFGQCKKEASAVIADCAKIIISGGQSASAMYIDTSGKVRCCGNLSSGNGRNSVAAANQNLFQPIFTSTDNALSDLPPTYQALEILYCGATGLLRCADKCLYGFGYNGHAQIGDNTTTAKANPTRCGKGTANAAALNGTVERFLLGNSVDNQTFGVYAQVTDGSLFVWGYGAISNLPAPVVAATQPTRPNVWGSTPQPNIMRIFSWMTAAAGAAAQYAMLFADGTVWTWGTNNLNDNTASINPAQIPRPLGMPTIVDGYGAAVGQYTTFFVKLSDGTWRAWGAQVGPAASYNDNTFTLFGAYGFFHFGFPNCPTE